MISVLAILGGGLTVALVVAVMLLTHALNVSSEREHEANVDARVASKAQLEAERGQLQAEKLRDQAVERAAAAEVSTARAFAQLTAAQRNANAAREELIEHVKKDVVGDPAAVVDRLLRARLPGAANASKPAAAGDGTGGEDAVSASALAAADKVRRLSQP